MADLRTELEIVRRIADDPAVGGPDAEAVYRIVYEEGVRAIDQQVATLDSLYSRVGVVFAAASISTAFLGGIAVGDGTPTPLTWAAIASFLISSVLLLDVLRPRHDWVFVLLPHKILTKYWEGSDQLDLNTIYRRLGVYSEKYFRENGAKIGGLVRRFNAAVAFLIVEVIAWLVDIGHG